MKRFILVSQVLIVGGICSLAQAATVFQASPGTDIFAGANWDNGLPSIANGDGTIAVAGTYAASVDFNEAPAGTVIVSHTAGFLNGGNWSIVNAAVGGATYAWNQSGGQVDTYYLVMGNRTVFTLSGTGYIRGIFANARIAPAGTGVFAQTGGEIWNLGVEAGNGTTIELSGGKATALGGAIPASALWGNGSSASVIRISGDHMSQIAPAVVAANVIVLTDGASLVFDPAWVGLWTRSSFSAADWETAVTDTGVKVGATQVTAGNFGSLFTVASAGTANSALRLASAPGTYYRSGDLTLAASWDNGLPAVGNDGRIMFGGTFGASLDLADSSAGTVTVTHASGTFVTAGALDLTLQNSGTAPCEWTQSGGQITARVLYPGNKVDYTLSDDGVIAASGVSDGSRVHPSGSGTFTQTGGTLNSVSVWNDNGTTLELTSGRWLNAGNGGYYGIYSYGSSNSIIRIGGDFTIESTSAARTTELLVHLASSAQFVFAADWQGSWTADSYTRSDWVTALDDTGVKVGTTQVTDSNFDKLFTLTNAGASGSMITIRPAEGTVIAIR